jgi:hypothetical protein
MDTPIAVMLPFQQTWANEFALVKKQRKLVKNRAEKQRVKDKKAEALAQAS